MALQFLYARVSVKCSYWKQALSQLIWKVLRRYCSTPRAGRFTKAPFERAEKQTAITGLQWSCVSIVIAWRKWIHCIWGSFIPHLYSRTLELEHPACQMGLSIFFLFVPRWKSCNFTVPAKTCMGQGMISCLDLEWVSREKASHNSTKNSEHKKTKQTC